MNLFDFLISDKSQLKMYKEENRRLMHEIANLKQKDMLASGGLTEHKLRRVLREVLTEELSSLSHAQLEQYEIQPVYDGRNGNGYQPVVSGIQSKLAPQHPPKGR